LTKRFLYDSISSRRSPPSESEKYAGPADHQTRTSSRKALNYEINAQGIVHSDWP